MLFSKNLIQPRNGFTLLELMVVLGIVTVLAGLFSSFLVEDVSKIAVKQKKLSDRDSLLEATKLIDSEIKNSRQVFTSNFNTLIPSGCNLTASEARIAIDLGSNLSYVIYGVRSVGDLTEVQRLDWPLGNWPTANDRGVLVRCGPPISLTPDGLNNYLSIDATANVDQVAILGGINILGTSNGFEIIDSDAKKVTYALSTVNNFNAVNRIESSTFSRAIASEESLGRISSCQAACSVINGIKTCPGLDGIFVDVLDNNNLNYDDAQTTQNSNNTIICGINDNGASLDINVSSGDNVIDCEVFPGVQSISGCQINASSSDGANTFFGTSSSDTMTGGSGSNKFIGRGGSDTFNSGGGDNIYSPWTDVGSLGNVTINGGSGLDLVYLQQRTLSEFDTSSCSDQSSCDLVLTSQGITVQTSCVETIYFADTSLSIDPTSDPTCN